MTLRAYGTITDNHPLFGVCNLLGNYRLWNAFNAICLVWMVYDENAGLRY
jgi:hypothetical protein